MTKDDPGRAPGQGRLYWSRSEATRVAVRHIRRRSGEENWAERRIRMRDKLKPRLLILRDRTGADVVYRIG
jgi:hypothetical protein